MTKSSVIERLFADSIAVRKHSLFLIGFLFISRLMVGRRQLLRAVGGAITIGTFAGSVAANGDSGKNRPETRVHPFFDQEVPVGNRLNHSIIWIEQCGTPREIKSRLREYLDKIAVDAHITGETIQDTSQYWSDPFKYDDGIYGVKWNYPTEPRSQGTYEFDITLRMTEPYVAPDPLEGCNETRELLGTMFVGETEYTVTPDAGAGHASDGTLSPEDV